MSGFVRSVPQPVTYGGQAVIEGVMIRGGRSMSVAARRPDGTIATHSTPLGGIYRSPLKRTPVLRGIFVLWETLALGVRALTWSAGIASDEVDEDGNPPPVGVAGWVTIVITFAFGLSIFFAGPVLLTVWLDSVLPSGWLVVLAEGAIRLGLLIGYIWLIGRSDGIERVFQYHGAEHMTIRAYEDGALPDAALVPSSGPAPVAAIRRFERAHPRCGTSFLLTVAAVSIAVFVLLGTPPLWWRVASRLAFIPVVAALSYEAIRLAGRYPSHVLVHWFFAGNLALQRLTTREPDDEQIQVAAAALAEAIASDQSAGPHS
ncbi:MAG: DUF1385 domain-containing protein [Dehalococcoidia bacterium]|nr:DUF1385 domain-containing protein [Dehalococcoidia bacterium]